MNETINDYKDCISLINIKSSDNWLSTFFGKPPETKAEFGVFRIVSEFYSLYRFATVVRHLECETKYQDNRQIKS